MPKILGNTQVVGTLTATSVNGISGISNVNSDIKANGVQSAGSSSKAAAADHVHPDLGGSSIINNFSAIVDPLATDDTSKGYTIGSV
jgi:hypothetical protein